MLEGITVLNQTEIMDSPSWLIWTIAIGAVVLIIVIGLLVTCLTDSDGFGVFVGGVVAILYGLMLCATFANTVPTGRYKYEVIIDESVSFEDIYENYDVIEQRGDLWILEDKEKMSE